MTDWELLELAAKAAGYEFVKYHIPRQDPSCSLSTTWTGPTAHVRKPDAPHECAWNPLANDGDALGLAVRLGADVTQHLEEYVVSVTIIRSSNYAHAVEPYYGDPCAATRRAIVQAAAEIGRELCK